MVYAGSITLPTSSSTVSVKIFNAFQSLTMPSPQFYSAAPNSTFDEASVPFCAPGKSFLLEHPDGRKVVFDLGIRKDLSTMAEPYGTLVRDGKLKVEFGPDVAETLLAEGFALDSIDAVIWSHAHLDHTGNPSTFPPSTALVVGPGTQAHVRPGYPKNPKGMIPESDFLGRDVVEIEFKDDAPLIAGLKTHDYFGDGSFYLLNAPGHCPGHMLGLARTTPTTFILFGADAAHHPALIRPSELLPLPTSLADAVPQSLQAVGFDKPFLDLPVPPFSGHHDNDRAKIDLQAILALDANKDVLVILPHDAYLDPRPGHEGGIDLLPKAANEWQKHGWKEAMHWKFLDQTHPQYRWA